MNLTEISIKNKTDKEWAHKYISNFYEEKFAQYKDSCINIVEIGVQNGFSIKTWREYFTNANLIGIDVDDKGFEEMKGVKYILGDAYDKNTVEKIPDSMIIIDDGPHSYTSQVRFILHYLPKLQLNGLLIIEDIQSPNCFVWQDYLDVFDELVNYLSKYLNREYEIEKKVTEKTHSDSLIYCVKRIK